MNKVTKSVFAAACISIFILLSLPLSSRGASQSRTEGSPVSYKDSASGLRNFLQDMLLAAKRDDQPALSRLIKYTEIPNYETWFVTTFGSEPGESWVGPYGKNLDSNEQSLRELLIRLAQQDGAFLTRNVNGAPESGNGLEKGLVSALKPHVNIYYAEWNARGNSKELMTPIGYFMFVDANFRWDSTITVLNIRTLKNTDAATPLNDLTQSIERPPDSSDTGNEEPRHPGKDGIGYPKCLYCPSPEYSKEAKKAKLQGTVVLQAVIESDGHANNIEIKQSVSPDLDEIAIATVRKWRFQPALNQHGEPVSVIIPLELSFHLAN